MKQLWLQENAAAGELTIVKIPRAEGSADALTHPWGVSDLPLWKTIGLKFISQTPVHPKSHTSGQCSLEQTPVYMLFV